MTTTTAPLFDLDPPDTDAPVRGLNRTLDGLLTTAEHHGWTVIARRGTGHYAKTRSNDTKPVGQREYVMHLPCDAVLVYLTRGPQRAWGVWVNKHDTTAGYGYNDGWTWTICTHNDDCPLVCTHDHGPGRCPTKTCQHRVCLYTPCPGVPQCNPRPLTAKTFRAHLETPAP